MAIAVIKDVYNLLGAHNVIYCTICPTTLYKRCVSLPYVLFSECLVLIIM